MVDSDYTVQRTIEDITFDKMTVEEVRESVRHDMIDEGKTNLNEDEVEKEVKERLLEIAKDQTLYDQADNELHLDINHELNEQ